ncbi:uncharacterized protein LOC124489844 isoform X3 [Dermatophagoides farinae]|uniref:uncharacterized protein LOC124489844 isoform X3 n=1 Tax=Dermatophagoides farinae TaxID=6954 RepID=UPI003F5D91EB
MAKYNSMMIMWLMLLHHQHYYRRSIMIIQIYKIISYNIIINSNKCDDEITDVTMADDCYYDNNSQCDPGDKSFLALDGQLNDPNSNHGNEQEYWRNTRDCDYRQLPNEVAQSAIVSTSNLSDTDCNNRFISEKPPIHDEDRIENAIDKLIQSSKNNVIIADKPPKHLSRKKRKKLYRKSKGIDLTKKSKSNAINNEQQLANIDLDSVVVDEDDDSISIDGIELADIDKLEFDELITYYNKLKEEFTLLNFSEQSEVLDKDDGTTVAATEIPILDFDEISSTDIDDNDDDDGSDSMAAPSMQSVDSNSNICLDDVVVEQPQQPLLDNDDDNVNKTIDEVIPNATEDESHQPQLEENSNNDNSTNWLLNEQILREKLIRSMMEKKKQMTNENSSTESPPQTQQQQQQRGSPLSVINCNGNSTSTIVSNNLVITESSKPKIDLSHYRLVIHLSSDDESEIELVEVNKCSNTVVMASTSSSSSTKTITSATNANTSVIKKLSKSQQQEYEKLRKEIERREASAVAQEKMSIQSKKMDSLRKSLNVHESRYRQTIVNVERKKGSINGLNRKFVTLKKKLTKSKNRLLKLKHSYTLAQKSHKLLAIQLQLSMKEMNVLKQSMSNDSTELQKHHTACMRIGRQLHGPQYQLAIQPSKSQKQLVFSESQQINGKKKLQKKQAEKKKQKENRLQSLRYFRNRIQSSMRNFANANTVFILLQHCVHFNFRLIHSSRFFQSKCSIPFSDFTENSSQRLDSNQLDRYCTGLDFHNYQSVLCHFNSYRFADMDDDSMSDRSTMDFWSNGLSPMARICHFDLMGACNDQTCCHQHQKDYLYGPREKLLDILAYSEEFSAEIPLDELKKNPRLLAEKLDEFLRRKQLTLDDKLSLNEIAKKFAQSIFLNDQSKISLSSLLIRLFPKEMIQISMAADRNNSFQTKVPFDDYRYRFDHRSLDDLFDLKLDRLVNDYKQIDPDLFIQYRYFAPEGVPITAQLESSLAIDPHNVQMWINLAYYHLSKISAANEDRLYCMDSALNVLTRALESNRNCGELYEHYLLIWVNRLDLLHDDPKQLKEQNKKICHQILKNCSTYPLWIRYLHLCTTVVEKLSISLEILIRFMQPNGIEYKNDNERSLRIVEMVFYRINLMLHLNRHQDAVKFFNDIFNPTSSSMAISTDSNTTTKTLDFGLLSSLVIAAHRSFAWHCYIHLVLYSCLPYHCFDLSGNRGQFLPLLNTEPFIFEWNDNDGINRSELLMIKKIFKRALRNCCLNGSNDNDCTSRCSCPNPIDTCFALRLNLTNLNKMLIKTIDDDDGDGGDIDQEEDGLDNYLAFIFIDQNRNSRLLNDLHILHLFEIDLETNFATDNNDNDNNSKMLTSSGMVNLIENFHRKSSLKSNHDSVNAELSIIQTKLKFNYWLAFYHQRLGNVKKCREILRQNLSYFYEDFHNVQNNNDNDDYYIRLYEKILFHKDVLMIMIGGQQQQQSMNLDLIDLRFRFPKSSQQHNSLYLYLSYMLYNHITTSDDGDGEAHFLRLDTIYTTVINSSWNDNDKDGNFVKLLSFNHFLMLLDYPSSTTFCDSYFKIIYENLRHICLTFGDCDPTFIYHLVMTVGDFIQPSDRLYFLIELCRLNPTNMMLVLKVCNEALQQKKKETLWKLIAYIVYERKIRLHCLEFWKIAISLSVERGDHLNAHKLFQLAITLMPYNTILWDMLKNYEKSIDHQEHLAQILSYYHDSLGMDNFDDGNNNVKKSNQSQQQQQQQQ